MLRAEPDPDARQREIGLFADARQAGDLSGIAEKARQLGDDETTRELCLALVRRWAAEDSRLAAEWAERLPPGPLKGAILNEVAIVWSDRSLSDAAAWARALPDKVERGPVLLAVAGEAIRSDPFTALQLTGEVETGPLQVEVQKHAAMEWAAHDGPAAIAWARQIADSNLRDRMLGAIAIAWSNDDPEAAATLATVEVSSDRDQADAIISIVQRWAQSEPDRAAEWVRQFPAGELKQTAMENLKALGKP